MHAYRDQYAQIFNGGKDVVLIAISADPVQELASWAHDDDFPFLLASDAGQRVAQMYGAAADETRLSNRNLYVIGPDGKIAYTATPFGAVDPTAYANLEAAIDRIAPADEEEPGEGR